MKTTLFKDFAKSTIQFANDHSSTILTATGAVGMIATIIATAKAAPKANDILAKHEANKGEKLSPVEKTVALASVYWPTALLGACSLACFIGANSINLKEKAALAGAYSIAEKKLTEYQDKVTETIGVKKEQAIRDDIARERVENNPPVDNQIIITGKGETLCFDTISGRYFKADIEDIRRAVNDINEIVRSDDIAMLNDFYNQIGLGSIRIGDDLGWTSEDKKFLSVEYSSQLTGKKEPVLVLDYKVYPLQSDYHKWY